MGSTRPFLISSIMGIREEKDHHGHSAAVMAAAAAAAESTMAAMNEEYLKRMQRHAAGTQKSLFKQSINILRGHLRYHLFEHIRILLMRPKSSKLQKYDSSSHRT